METFRVDTLPEGLRPLMSYVSMTGPGIARGPHEHLKQTDIFAFCGPGMFKIVLWDNRQSSVTCRAKMIVFGGEDIPISIIVPPGVVHAYLNMSQTEIGMNLNYPDALYAGWGKAEAVDEIRHEVNGDPFFEDFRQL
jgi:dTDP-4-dehydrorhamnose 3,5-epimerase